jgi:hypothetical protein
MADETATRCAYAGCTCHTQDGAQYCSDACRTSATTGAHSGCACGHAGCTAVAYVRERTSPEIGRTAPRGHF